MRGGVLTATVLALVAGCSSSSHPPSPREAALPATSPLANCVDTNPTPPRPIATELAGNFRADIVRRTFSLDGGILRVSPPSHDPRPQIPVALARCNLLAASTAQNDSVFAAVQRHGMDFGLGVVTISDRVLRPSPQDYIVGGQQQRLRLAPYHSRLAWIAITQPDVVFSCPAMTNPPSPRPGATTPSRPGYQVLLIDAQTGTAGTIYSTRANNGCGLPGYTKPGVSPAAIFVSAPWSLVSRGPGPKAAMIRYPARPCDLDNMGSFLAPRDVGAGPIPSGAGTPAIFADRKQPGLVRVEVQRLLVRCGAPTTRRILLRSADLQTDLPARLEHAAVGAMDVPS